jgi:hypothetical protein
VTCNLPNGYSIETSNSNPDYFYLITPDGLLGQGEDIGELCATAWRLYRAGSTG